MKHILIISCIILSKLTLGSYNDKYRVQFPLDAENKPNWLTPFNGEYVFSELVNDQPSWKQISDTERVLFWTGGSWEFTDGTPGSPTCSDSPPPNRPEDCTKWWGYDGPDQVVIEAYGNEIPDGETSTTSTTSKPSTTDNYNLIYSYPECFYGANPLCLDVYKDKTDEINFNDKICITYDGWNWLTPYSGDFTYMGIKDYSGYPYYQMSACRDDDNCIENTVLSNGPQWKLINNDGPTCLDRTYRPELCNNWWGGQNPTISACGNEQTIQYVSSKTNYLPHPNYAERIHYTLVNMARLYPSQYKDSKYGGMGEYNGGSLCGVAQTVPLYYNLKLNEAARYHNYDEQNCMQDPGHKTCDNPNRCSLFDGSCEAADRWSSFENMSPDDGSYVSSEGICGHNGCYLDGHCDAVFDEKHSVIGIGIWPGANSFDILYGKDDNDKSYPLVHGAHLDNRYIFSYYYNDELIETDNQLTFILQYYGVNIDYEYADEVYLLYKGQRHEMNLIFGDNLSGFYEKKFVLDSNDINDKCEPYAFQVRTNTNGEYRLPQDKNYYFSTAFFDEFREEPLLYECTENHYYYDNEWIANDGPSNKISSNDECIGCSKCPSLQNWEF